MWTFDITSGWQETSAAYAKSNPGETGLLWANISVYEKLLALSKYPIRPELDGLTEEDMGIVAIRQKVLSDPPQLVAYAYPDEKSKVVLLIKMGKIIEKDADLEYVKKCVKHYLN